MDPNTTIINAAKEAISNVTVGDIETGLSTLNDSLFKAVIGFLIVFGVIVLLGAIAIHGIPAIKE